jgi:hypothetical protein
MVAPSVSHEAPAPAPERQFPPITQTAGLSMALVVIGGIYIAAYVPKSVPLAPAVILLAAATVVLVANVVILGRLQNFAWGRFFQVFQWALLAYVVTAGMIGYVFVADGTRGGVLAVLIGMLMIYAVNIPMLLAFSVARYEDSGARAAGQ